MTKANPQPNAQQQQQGGADPAATQKPPRAPVADPNRKPKALTPHQAAPKLAALLNPKKSPAAPEGDAEQPQKPKLKAKPPAKPKAKTAQQEADTGQSEGDTADEADEDNGEGQQADQEPETDDTATEETDGEQPEGETEDGDAEGEAEEGNEELHTVTVDGQDYQVPYEELVAGYQRQADYTRKMQKVAEQRKEVETLKESVKDLPEQKKKYIKDAQQFNETAHLVLAALNKRFMPQPPNPDLSKTDPAAYIAQKEMYEEGMQFVHGLGSEMKKNHENFKAEHAKVVKAGREELYKLLPEMQDSAFRGKLTAYAHKHGFTNEQIMDEANPILFLWADKARRWDELQERKGQLKPKSPTPKVASRSNAQLSGKAVQAKKKNEVFAAHKASGTVASAGKALAQILK